MYMVKPNNDPEPLHSSLFESPLIYILVNKLCFIFKSLTTASIRHLYI